MVMRFASPPLVIEILIRLHWNWPRLNVILRTLVDNHSGLIINRSLIIDLVLRIVTSCRAVAKTTSLKEVFDPSSRLCE
jgi:hypothetical protein